MMDHDRRYESYIICNYMFPTEQHKTHVEPFVLPACFTEVTGAGFRFASAKEETSFGPQQLNVTLNHMNSMNPQVTFLIQQVVREFCAGFMEVWLFYASFIAAFAINWLKMLLGSSYKKLQFNHHFLGKPPQQQNLNISPYSSQLWPPQTAINAIVTLKILLPRVLPGVLWASKLAREFDSKNRTRVRAKRERRNSRARLREG